MRLTVLGSGPACPNPGGASAGYLLKGEVGQVLIDCGHGVASALRQMTSLEDLAGIVVSHMHPDHFFDLIPLKYCVGFTGSPRILLYLPPEGQEVLRRLQAALHLQENFYETAYEVCPYEPARELELGGFLIQFASNQHFVPTYAMRFVPTGAREPSLVYSSDTAPTGRLRELARGADLALFEATLLQPEDPSARGHMTASEAGKLAREAQVKKLVLTHYWAPLAEVVRLEGSRQFGEPVALAKQGESFTI